MILHLPSLKEKLHVEFLHHAAISEFLSNKKFSHENQFYQGQFVTSFTLVAIW